MMRRPWVRALAGVAVAALALAALAHSFLGESKGTSDENVESSAYLSTTGPVPATPQRPGDPAAGYRALVNAPYVSCGLPHRVYQRLSLTPDPENLLPGREGRNAELPYDLTAHVNADGIEIVSPNCLSCHASHFEGELVVGLGNEFLDFTQDPRRAANEAGLYVLGDAETAAWQRWADRIEGIAPYIQTSTLGANPATNLTWALMAHRDPETLAWSSAPLIEPPSTTPLPLSVPPWWRMQKKNAMFYTTIGRGDHARFMIMASMLCADSVEEAEAADAYAPDIRAYIESLQPPEFPFPVDAALAERGRALFETNCSACHGTYGEDASYPNLVIPLDAIGTDPDYALTATDGSLDRFYDWVTRSYYGESADMSPATGYIAPPLDGIWATAPYLHNGSVPDLRLLLDSRLRPDFWQHRLDPRTYNPIVLGWEYERLQHDKSAVAEPDAKARVYDTTLPGYRNGGHLFGDGLTDAERTAVIEYLKTL